MIGNEATTPLQIEVPPDASSPAKTEHASAINDVGGAVMAAAYGKISPALHAQKEQRVVECKDDLTYEALTKRNLANKVTHDDCLVHIMAAPDFLPRLKQIEARQQDSMQFNQNRQSLKESKKKGSLIKKVQTNLMCCGTDGKQLPQQYVEP